MIHLCSGLIPIPGSRYSRPCRQRVLKALGQCSRCDPKSEAKHTQSPAYSRAWRERQRKAKATAGLSPGMEAA